MGEQPPNDVAPPAAAPALPAAARDWFEQEAVLVNRQGLHAYPAHVVAHVANCFKKADVFLCHGERAVDAKSVLMLLGLSSESPMIQGTKLTVRASGVNARSAVAVLAAVLASGFGED